MTEKQSTDGVNSTPLLAEDRAKEGALIEAMVQNLPDDSPMLREAASALMRFTDRTDGPSFIRGYVCGHLDGMSYDIRSLPLWQRKHVAEKCRILHRLHRVLRNGGYGSDECAEIMDRLDALANLSTANKEVSGER